MTKDIRPFEEIRLLLLDLPPPCAKSVEAVRARDARLTKPPGALGRLEEIVQWLAAWQGRAEPAIEMPVVTVFAANHGVVAQGVSAFPPSVTKQMLDNFTAGGAAINQICKSFGVGLKVFELALEHPTQDFTQGPAMEEPAAAATLAYGMEAIVGGVDLLAPGEMGIGNTTSAAAIYAALYGGPAARWTGRGTGVDDAGLARKNAAIDAALALHGPYLSDPLEILRRLGGREIAGMMGAILAARREPRAGGARRLCRLLGGGAAARDGRGRHRPLHGRPCVGGGRASRGSGAARQAAAARSRHAPWRRFRRGAGDWADQGGSRLPPGHGDVRKRGG